ncbi:DUF6053 domain-containing protein [Lysobacter enzymogenes]|uniref:DUF6053 domain-containing protein n=1 Tax=Lysobacter enzymogenes TaxID=69 RepID=UPI003748979C
MPAVVGGPSGPMLSFQVAAISAKGIGPDGPPTVARPTLRARRKAYHSPPDSWNPTR